MHPDPAVEINNERMVKADMLTGLAELPADLPYSPSVQIIVHCTTSNAVELHRSCRESYFILSIAFSELLNVVTG